MSIVEHSSDTQRGAEQVGQAEPQGPDEGNRVPSPACHCTGCSWERSCSSLSCWVKIFGNPSTSTSLYRQVRAAFCSSGSSLAWPASPWERFWSHYKEFKNLCSGENGMVWVAVLPFTRGGDHSLSSTQALGQELPLLSLPALDLCAQGMLTAPKQRIPW